MNFYSEVLPQLLILAAPIAIGGVAWWRKARKTACVLWLLAVWMFVGTYVAYNGTPSQRRRASVHACIANLKQIDGAVQQWALEHQKKATNAYSFGDKSLLAYMKGSVLPDCPQGGRYTAGASVGDVPKCSLAAKGHTL